MDCIKIPIIYRSAGHYENTGENLVFVPPKQKRMTLQLLGPIYVDEEGVDDPRPPHPAPMDDTINLQSVTPDSSTDAILRGPRFNQSEDRATRNNQNPTQRNAMATQNFKKRYLYDEVASGVKKIKTKEGEADTATHVAASDVCTELKLGLFGR